MQFRLLPSNSPVGWTPYVWLVYLGWYFLYPFLRAASAIEWTVYVGGAVIFLALYFRGFWLEGRPLLRIVAAIVALGVVYVPWNPGASAFFIYAAGFLGGVGPPAVAFRCLLVLLGVIGVETWLLTLPPPAWIPAVVFSILVGGPNIYFSETRRAGLRTQKLRDEVARATERERIARDVHDLLGHTLSVIVLKSELASKLAGRDAARATAEIRDVESIARDALAQVRQAVQGWRSEGLDAEIGRARAALEAADVSMRVELADIDLPPREAQVLAWALREAVTNVIRHARANRCWIALAHTNGRLVLDVHDDGIGGEAPEGSGLSGMRARLSELQGTVERDGRHGTHLRVSLPDRGRAPALAGLRDLTPTKGAS
ncbi:MAG: sensor histidine kinase [Luteitalea sp.]|nr:sensor histidine kinase [Luteitalea sp.]